MIFYPHKSKLPKNNESEEFNMTFLDLLIVVSMLLLAGSLLSVVLMFAIRNQIVRRIFFYMTVALGLYVGYVGARINWMYSYGQMLLAILMALTGVAAVVLERVRGKDAKCFLIARLMSASALTFGLMNALMI